MRLRAYQQPLLKELRLEFRLLCFLFLVLKTLGYIKIDTYRLMSPRLCKSYKCCVLHCTLLAKIQI